MPSRSGATINPQFLRDSSGCNDSKRANLENEIVALQWAQLQHDRFYHADIALLPVGERMKHFALHMAKYVGHIAEAVDGNDDTLLRRILIDSFIISLASANTLQLNLGRVLRSSGNPPARNLQDLGTELARAQPPANRDTSWLMRTMARHAGILAKACESLDHVEDYPFRAQMLGSTRKILEVVLAAAALREIHLVDEAAARIAGIEANHMFHDRHE